MKRNALPTLIILLTAFEVANLFITSKGLEDFLQYVRIGDIIAIGVTLGFCVADFAAARYFSKAAKDETEANYWFFGGWLLLAGLNAAIWWWSIYVDLGMGDDSFSKGVSIFVAAVVGWLIRVLIVGGIVVVGKFTK